MGDLINRKARLMLLKLNAPSTSFNLTRLRSIYLKSMPGGMDPDHILPHRFYNHLDVYRYQEPWKVPQR